MKCSSSNRLSALQLLQFFIASCIIIVPYKFFAKLLSRSVENQLDTVSNGTIAREPGGRSKSQSRLHTTQTCRHRHRDCIKPIYSCLFNACTRIKKISTFHFPLSAFHFPLFDFISNCFVNKVVNRFLGQRVRNKRQTAMALKRVRGPKTFAL